MVRLYATGKITEGVWNNLWQEWQDRRTKIQTILKSLEFQHKNHISNLDAALEIIVQIGFVYNSLERSDQKELLRHVVERVIVDPVGKIRLELHAPFTYLCDISNQVSGKGNDFQRDIKAKTDNKVTGLSSGKCSDSILLCGRDRIRTCVSV